MKNKSFEKIYEWDKLGELFDEFIPELIGQQENIRESQVFTDLGAEEKEGLHSLEIPREGREAREVARELIDKVYPYSMKTNHPRNFCFIPNDVSPYSVFGDLINSMNNPYGGGFAVSKGTAIVEEELIKWMGSFLDYDRDSLGGQFVSGGSMANLTAMTVARDDKLRPEDFIRGTVYVSDQTHSSVAKGVHVMGISRENVRKIESDDGFRMKLDSLERAIKEDIENGYKPFLLVGTSGTTNTGSIDPLEDLADLAAKYNMWFHVDGAYGASALLSSHRELLRGIERSDSVSWDGHKWLYQTYGCAAVICRDKSKLLRSFHVNPEYLKDVESQGEDLNFWDMGIELTKPARGMRLWFTLQTLGLDLMREAIDQAFVVADWLEEEIGKYDHYEILSPSNMGIINFRYHKENLSLEEEDRINHRISQLGVEEGYAGFLTTRLKGKLVLRFCCSHPMTSREEIVRIVDSIEGYIEEIVK